jgi:GNAT superfamily N-acetyltransferase
MATVPTAFREAAPEDAEAIAALVGHCFATYRSFAPAGWEPPDREPMLANLAKRLAGVGVRSRLAFGDAPRAAGFCAWTPARTEAEPRTPIPGLAHLWMLFVHPDHWGTGLAAELLGWAEAGMSAAAYDAARLWTPTAHDRARAFYARCGWRPSGRAQFGRDLDLSVVEYWLDLA